MVRLRHGNEVKHGHQWPARALDSIFTINIVSIRALQPSSGSAGRSNCLLVFTSAPGVRTQCCC
jgi:hypothetical protein